MATVSLCMIVKNEEKILEKCIDSVKSIIDEFVIVDTGSTDGTKDIIKKYGKLHEIPFANYVKTKNAALKLAKSDYILFLDADETVVSGLEFLKEHAETGTECVYAKIIEGSDDVIANTYFRARLWKNNGKWKFVGPGVHETLSGGESLITDHRILIRHDHSHRTPESYKEKFNQYVEILNKHLKKHPKDPRTTFYLGRTYKDVGNYLESITQYKRYLDFNTTFIDERWQAAYDIALCWKSQGEYSQCVDACALAEKIDPRRAETFVLLGQIYFDLQNWDESIKWFTKASELPVPTDVMLFMNPLAHKEIPLDYLVLCYDKKKEYHKASEITEQLINFLSKPDQRLVNNLTWLRKQEYKNIFFCLGNTPEPVYGDMIEKQGVGGVETTFIELPTELAKIGHNVFVFCKCEEPHKYKGVYFVPYEKINDYAKLKPDIVISSRWFDVFYIFSEAKKIAWMQDAHYADPNHSDAWQVIDAFICSSLWHRQYTAERLGQRLDAKKINVIPLSIRGELFQNKNIERDSLKVIFSSNPDRGLYILKDMWNEICEKIPGIHLTITYGWEGLKTWSTDQSWLKQQEDAEKRVTDWAKEAGNVVLTGRLTKAKLAEEMMSSSACVYPNNFWESFCLTALETQVAGTPMITTRLGALTTTLSNEYNVLIDENPFSKEYKKKFINSTVELMKDSEKRNAYSKGCISYFEKQPSWKEVAEQWERLFWNI